jgi:hypothetical protein
MKGTVSLITLQFPEELSGQEKVVTQTGPSSVNKESRFLRICCFIVTYAEHHTYVKFTAYLCLMPRTLAPLHLTSYEVVLKARGYVSSITDIFCKFLLSRIVPGGCSDSKFIPNL